MRRLGLTPSQQIVLEWLVIQGHVLESAPNVWTNRSLRALARRGLADLTDWRSSRGDFWQATEKGVDVARQLIAMDRRFRQIHGLPARGRTQLQRREASE